MPLIRPEHDHICAYCFYYTFVRRVSGGWAYCEKHKTWFPNQRGWTTDKSVKPAGERTCGEWETK